MAKDGTGRMPSLLDEFKPYLRQRWNAGCTAATVLFAEIHEQGFRGSYQTFRDYVRPFRSITHVPEPPPAPPKVRQVVGWLMCHPDDLDAENEQRLTAILARWPELQATRRHVRMSADMMSHLGWMAAISRRGWPPSKPTNCPRCTPSSPDCAATRTRSPPASPCPGAPARSKGTSTGSFCGIWFVKRSCRAAGFPSVFVLGEAARQRKAHVFGPGPRRPFRGPAPG
jgi:hypothetical protein